MRAAERLFFDLSVGYQQERQNESRATKKKRRDLSGIQSGELVAIILSFRSPDPIRVSLFVNLCSMYQVPMYM